MARSEVPTPQPETALASEMADVVSAARAEMDRLIQVGGLQRDPLRHPIEALSVHLDALCRLCTSLLANIGQATKPPPAVFTDKQVEEIGRRLAGSCNAWAGSMVKAANLSSWTLGILALVIMAMFGFLGGWFYRGPAPELICNAAAIADRPICFRYDGPAPTVVPDTPPPPAEHSSVPANKTTTPKAKS